MQMDTLYHNILNCYSANRLALTAVMAPALKSYFETAINLKQNNPNFGVTIYLKSRANRQAAKR